jgi:hypothetical protein
MNKQLLEEIKRFRQISNLKNKPLINEGRGEGANVLWRFILDFDDKNLLSGGINRETKLLEMMSAYNIKVSLGNNIGSLEEKTARNAKITEINNMIENGAKLSDVVAKIETIFGDKYKTLEDSLGDYIEVETQKELKEQLTDPDSELVTSMIKDFNDEVTEKVQQDGNWAKYTPLVKKKILDQVKALFIEKYNKLLGFKEPSPEVAKVFSEPYTAKLKELTGFEKALDGKNLMVSLRNLPLLFDDLFEIFNLRYLTINKQISELEKEIDDLVILIEQNQTKSNAAKIITDRIKILAIKLKDENPAKSFESLYDDIMKKIEEGIPDEKLRSEIIRNINDEIIQEGNKVSGLLSFFQKLDKIPSGEEVRLAKWEKIVQFIEPLRLLWYRLFKQTEKLGDVGKRMVGFAQRWWSYAQTGTLNSFKDYVDDLSKARSKSKNKTVRGFGNSSIFDMYIRIWVRANIAVPIIINIFLSTFFNGFMCLFNKDNSIEKIDEVRQKYCRNPFSVFWDNEVESLKDSFRIIDLAFNNKNDSVVKILYEAVRLFWPLNSSLDDFVKYFLYGNPDDDIKNAKDKSNKNDKQKGEKELEEKNPKLALKKEAEVAQTKTGISGWGARSEIDGYEIKADSIADLIESDLLSDNTKPMFTYKGKTYHVSRNMKGWEISRDNDGYEFDLTEFIDQIMGGPAVKNESIIKKVTNMILENNSGKKFGDDNFKHWKDTFTFKAIDEKNPGQYKEVKINMEDVMDRINHYRKKYDEDDAFVRAVIDTHEDVVKVMFTKDLAHLQETHKPLGLALILQQISESRGEMEIWSVARPANGNWFLVKGDYTPKQMVTMDLQKNEPRNKETKVVTRAEDDLKKKEISAIQKLKNDEKSGLEELPIKVREKVKEKISRGWTTEVPFETFDVYYKKSEINSAFNEKIKIYKLIPSNEFFNSLIKNSSRIRTKRGFCKSISNITNEFKMTESQQKIADHILNACNKMYGNQKLKKYKPVNQND